MRLLEVAEENLVLDQAESNTEDCIGGLLDLRVIVGQGDWEEMGREVDPMSEAENDKNELDRRALEAVVMDTPDLERLKALMRQDCP